MTFKLAVKTIARRCGLHATFMPKPKFGVNGSGMHTNMSLARDGRNLFRDDADENGLSQEAYYFMGGIFRHIKGITAITNPIVNSYKRLVPGYEAPVDIAWSAKYRKLMIRIPEEREENTRIELRSPDPSCNPYLALAVCLAAGLDGIRNRLLPPACVDRSVTAMTKEERKELHVDSLPGSLLEALEELGQDSLLMGVLGERTGQNYILAKKEEWTQYCSQVTDWEIENYLYRI